MSLVSVIVDSRESWTKGLRFGGVPVTTDEQISTDVLALCDDGALIGFERKQADDLLQTMKADRLFPQMSRLRELTPFAYLIICGELRMGARGTTITNRGETGWNWSSVSGCLRQVQEIGVCIEQCRDEDFEATVLRIANHDRGPVRVKPARDISQMTEGEVVLTSLPGIGPDKADHLMRYCGSAAWALVALTDASWAIPSIGDGIKRKVRRALGLEGDALIALARTDQWEPIKRGGD
jgi:ERCC4-type nuclease